MPIFLTLLYVKLEANDLTLEVIWSQMGGKEKLHLVAFYSKKIFVIIINYGNYNKEFLAATHLF